MYHKITIAGVVGRDPEMRYLPNGNAVTSFSVAVTDGFGENKTTIWFKVVIFGKRAETANQYLSKGSRVLVEGRMGHESGSPKVWQGKDGSYKSSFEIVANDFAFLSSSKEGEHPTPSQVNTGGKLGSSLPDEDDDIGF